MKIKFNYFILGAILGVLTLFTQVRPAEALTLPPLPNIPVLPDLVRLIPLPRIISPLRSIPSFNPIRPLDSLRSLPPITTIVTTPSPTSTPTPTFLPVITSTPTVTSTPTPTPTLTSTPTVTPTSSLPLITPTETLTPTPTSTPTPTLPLQAGLVAYWKMEQGQDSGIVSDFSGNGYDLVLASNPLPVWSDDIPSTTNFDTQSLLFDGDNYAQLANSSHNTAFDFTSGFTIEAWIKATSSQPDPDAGIISKFNGTGTGYIMWLKDDGKIANYINGSTNSSTTNIRDDNWHHVAITWDGETKAVFADGIQETSASWNQPPQSIGFTFLVGTYAPPGFRNLAGNIDELRVYNYARSQTQIQEDAGFIGGVPTLTPTPTSTPTATPTPTSTPVVYINEFLPSPSALLTEWVEFYNPNSFELTSYWLDDDLSFLDDTGSKAKINLASLNTTNPIFPYIETSAVFNNNGDMVVLFSNDGTLIDQTSYSANPGVDKSIGRVTDGGSSWQICTSTSKGASNSSNSSCIPL